MSFCLLVCQMCGKGTFLQIRSHILNYKCDNLQQNWVTKQGEQLQHAW